MGIFWLVLGVVTLITLGVATIGEMVYIHGPQTNVEMGIFMGFGWLIFWLELPKVFRVRRGNWLREVRVQLDAHYGEIGQEVWGYYMTTTTDSGFTVASNPKHYPTHHVYAGGVMVFDDE